MTIESDAVAGATIELLEARLRRLTYLLGGATDWTGVPTTPEKPGSLDETVSRRLARLEREIATLSRRVPAVRDVIQLRTCESPTIVYACPEPRHALNLKLFPMRPSNSITQFQLTKSLDDRFPDLFQNTPAHEIPEGLTTRTLASIVLSYATAFPETASRLTSLQDLPVPDPQSSAKLIELQPQLDRLAQTQTEQAAAISELRIRTARVLQRWYEVGIVGNGECWAEWEGRLEDMEREVRRREVAKHRRENEV